MNTYTTSHVVSSPPTFPPPPPPAGKTTLLDVLAGRKNSGVQAGTILLNGFPKENKSFARLTAYCEQNDIHNSFSTVRACVRGSRGGSGGGGGVVADCFSRSSGGGGGGRCDVAAAVSLARNKYVLVWRNSMGKLL